MDAIAWLCIAAAFLINTVAFALLMRELRRWRRLNAMLLALCIKAYGLQNFDLRAAWRIYMRRRAAEAE